MSFATFILILNNYIGLDIPTGALYNFLIIDIMHKKSLNWISNLHKNSIHKKYCMSFSICNRHCLRYILKSCHIKKHFVSCSLCMHEFQLNLHVCLVFRSFVHSYFLCKCFQDIEYHDILYVRSIFGALIK